MTPDLPPPLDPAPPTDPGVAPAGQGLVEWVRTSRPAAAYLFLGLSALFLAATVFLVVRSLRTTPAADPAAAADPLDPDAKPPAIDDPKKGDFTAGWVATIIGWKATLGAGLFLLLWPSPPTAAAQRTEARTFLLVVGGYLGFWLIVFAGVFFYRWSDSLSGWLDKNDLRQRLYVIVPLLMAVAGIGLVFLAVQPARAEERHNQLLRRLVYGTNLALTVLLLLLVLVVGNVVVARKVQNSLDTTESGFYTLSDSTKAFLARLPDPVGLTVILPDTRDREVNDVRQFAYRAEEAAGGRLTARFVSPQTNKRELAELEDKYSRIDKNNPYGVLLTAGPDGRRHIFIPSNDLFDTNPRTGQLQGFAGEGKVMRELRFLADDEQKPVVYFTQASGELALGGDRGPEAAAGGGSVARLKGFLEKAYLDVRPLSIASTDKDAKVPDDAAVVVVAEPQVPLSEAAVGAIRRYMTEKKGKLIVLAGADPGGPEKVVPRTGLEAVLAELNVRLGDKFLYSAPTDTSPDTRAASTRFTQASESNPIHQSLIRQYNGFTFIFPREVAALAANPAYQAVPLLVTRPRVPTWLEAERLTDPEQAWIELVQNPAARARKGLTEQPRPVAVVVSEGGTGRAVVVGNSFVFSDQLADRVRGGTPPAFDLLTAAVDWLRDRPSLPNTVESKVYREYQFPEPAAVDTTRLVWFPLGLGLLIVIGFGAGVWVIRRK